MTTGLGPDGILGTADDVHQSYKLPNVWARGYVEDDWIGTNPAQNKLLCHELGCFDASESADHDVALLYIRSEYDDQLPPRVEWDGAKRLSITGPRSNPSSVIVYSRVSV